MMMAEESITESLVLSWYSLLSPVTTQPAFFKNSMQVSSPSNPSAPVTKLTSTWGLYPVSGQRQNDIVRKSTALRKVMAYIQYLCKSSAGPVTVSYRQEGP